MIIMHRSPAIDSVESSSSYVTLASRLRISGGDDADTALVSINVRNWRKPVVGVVGGACVARLPGSGFQSGRLNTDVESR